MPRSSLKRFLFLLLMFSALSGCATPLPPTYHVTPEGELFKGEVLALAGDGDILAAATVDGLFVKNGGGPWLRLEVPGVRDWEKVTSLAVDGEVIYLGSDGEGLHILSGGEWEVRTGRYGGLADDGVLSLALDGADDGLPGSTLWVGCRGGVTARHGDEWRIYRPGGDWLLRMSGGSGSGAGKVYLGKGFRLGRKGEDSKLFRPPVTAIAVGDESLVLGNSDSRLAILEKEAVATVFLKDDYRITRLLVDWPAIWAGTDRGLLWGGLSGEAAGKPWPVYQGYVGWSGSLFGSRDSKPFQYRWKRLGYNEGRVEGLLRRQDDLWVAYRAENGMPTSRYKRTDSLEDPAERIRISAVRLFPNLEEYITRKETPRFETYGPSAGVRGDPTAIYVSPDNRKLWIGTTGGLWELEK